MRLINWIKQAFVKATIDNVGKAYPRATAQYNGKETPFVQLTPYGLYHELPAGDGTHVLLFSSEGQEAVKFGIGQTYAERPELAKGEVAVGHPVTGALVIFKANGDITVDTPSDLIATVGGETTLNSTGDVNATAPNFNLTGDVNIVGNLDVQGTIDASATISSPTSVFSSESTIGGIAFTGHTHLYTWTDPAGSGATDPPA